MSRHITLLMDNTYNIPFDLYPTRKLLIKDIEEAKARTTPNMYDHELVHLRKELAMAWSEYRIAQKMLNNFAITNQEGGEVRGKL